MKKLSIFLLSVLALASCGKQESNPKMEWKSALTAVENNLIFTPDGGEATITLNENVTSATCSAAWITTSVSGKVVTLTAEPFTDGQSRYTSLQLKSAVGDLMVPVVQYGVIIDGLVIADIEAPVEGLVQTQKIQLNTALTLTSDVDWIHVEYDAEEGILTITVDENTAPGTREGTFSYSAGSESGTVKVKQQPPLGRESAWTLTNGDSYYEDPDFFLPISLQCAESDYYTLVALSADDVTLPVEDYVFNTLAPSQKKTLDALVTINGGAFKDQLLKGPFKDRIQKLPGFGDTYVILIGFGENGYITGQYQYIRLTVKDTRPGFFDNDGEDMDWGSF